MKCQIAAVCFNCPFKGAGYHTKNQTIFFGVKALFVMTSSLKNIKKKNSNTVKHACPFKAQQSLLQQVNVLPGRVEL